ncbi:HinT-interacting membrane complex protein P80 [Mycoplasma struthionis]|uniref:HinT-interacting membrane complex protein P80 n=1 Tax=Mycoplasma struthionis TaxID=538220 RepID=UPI0021BDDD84|nr:hypothetical protein [Mycoplasma struthionis]
MSEKVKVKTTEQKAKRKKVIWASVWTTAIAAVITTGVAVPLVQAHKSLPKPTPILGDNSVLLSLSSPNGDSSTITYGDVDKVHEQVNASKHIASEVEKHLVKYLYEQEYKGSLWYEAVYNADKAKSDEKTFALPSIDKVRQDVTKEIDDLEVKFQEQFGLEKKADEKFLEQLATPEYGNAKNKQEAIDYKVTQRLSNDAFRRYQTETNSDFTYSELKNGIVANKDVFYTYQGKRVDVAKKGTVINLSFATENQNYVLPVDSDVEVKTNTKDEIKIPIFVTKSFVERQKRADRFLAPWINRKQSITSSISLSAHPVAKDSAKEWSVTKDEIIKLLTFSAYLTDDGKVELALGVDKLPTFKGLSSLLAADKITPQIENAARNDEKLIQYVASDTSLASKYGSNGFENIKTKIGSKKSRWLHSINFNSFRRCSKKFRYF